MNASTCEHGCTGWCAACDFARAHPDGDPMPILRGLPGRAGVKCPRRGCGHSMAAHRDGICSTDRCTCGLPGLGETTRLRDLVQDIANEVEDEAPVVALMLNRALKVSGTW